MPHLVIKTMACWIKLTAQDSEATSSHSPLLALNPLVLDTAARSIPGVERSQ
jgi:hypothetical protein